MSDLQPEGHLLACLSIGDTARVVTSLVYAGEEKKETGL